MPSKQKTILSVIVIVILLTISSSSYGKELTKDSKNVDQEIQILSNITKNSIIVPDNYSTIQEAIDNSNNGDLIYVKSGVYKENIAINKEGLYLLGRSKYNTIIDCSGKKEDAVTISAPNVTFDCFTVTNAYYKKQLNWAQAGIKINASNAKIYRNRISYNRVGIVVYTPSKNLTISDNEFINDGILLGNYFENSKLDITDFRHKIQDNTVNSKPLLYIEDQKDIKIPIYAGQIILVNCSNVTVKNMYMEKNDFSIILAYCNNCTIKNSTIKNTDGELLLFASDNCTIENNIIDNTFKAICLEFKSKNNIIKNNSALNNYCGISLFSYTKNNLITQNNIFNNTGPGVEIVSYGYAANQHHNIISNNKIIDNKWGMNIYHNSSYNIIEKNLIKNNIIGIVINDSPKNTFQNNTLKKNLISAGFLNCHDNTWSNNYWKRPRILPKMIFGISTIGKIPVPWINLDRKPALKPTV